MKKLTFALVGILAVATMTAGAGAQTSASAQDRTWLMKNQQTSLAEIAVSNLALAKGGAEVRAMAQRLIADHEKASAENKTVSSALGVTPPSAPSPMQQQQAATLEGLSGAAFDRMWIQLQIAGHRLSIAATNLELSSGSNTKVTSFAKEYLPVAEMHLRMALALSPMPSGGVATGGGGMARDAHRSSSVWALPAGATALFALGALVVRRRISVSSTH